ncbi:MAG TPA: HPr family phosphocarrier protein [Virgibacillus sp.]|nr:HPr family phosphocarrier protein [Virgibacillus sp.]
MIEKSVKVELETGLQARPAAQFVQEANRFSSNVFLEKDGKQVNAKSIMGIMSLAITQGETITLMADGADEKLAIDHLVSFVSKE